jgi:hypothetical protein
MSRSLPIVSARAAALLAVALLAVALLTGASGPSTAQTRRPDQDRARDAVREGSLAPLSQVLATIAARTPGEQLDTRFGETVDGRPVYVASSHGYTVTLMEQQGVGYAIATDMAPQESMHILSNCDLR